MASHEGSRKKRKMVYTDDATSSANSAPVIASSSKLPTPPNTTSAMAAKPASAPCHHEQALKALNTDLDAMRSLITCNICHRLLYEPYALSCGHTYCYSCLSQWLGGNAKMTCPDCRVVIRQQPTPSYLIRELVLIFVSRNELLPDGETAEEHNRIVREEAEIVAKDKANTDERHGGLFKGRFKRSRVGIFGPIHDPHDGVERCPECNWEMEDGRCNSCGYEMDEDFRFNDESGSSIGYASDEDIDHELGIMHDDGDVFVGADGAGGLDYLLDGQTPESPGRRINTAPRRWPRYGRPASVAGPIHIDLEEDSEDEDEDDDYDFQDTFIDDEAIDDGEDGSGVESDVTAGRTPVQPTRRRTGPRGTVVISDDEDEDEDQNDEVVTIRPHPVDYTGPRWNRLRRAPVSVDDDDDDEDEDEAADETALSATQASDQSESDSEDEGPVVRGSQRNKRPNVAVRARRALTISSDDDHDSESGIDDASQGTVQGGFSPVDNGFADAASEQTDYDDDFYGTGEGEDEDEDAQGFAPAAPQYFNPYEEDTAPGGYDDEESDGWGSLCPTNEVLDVRLTEITGTTASTDRRGGVGRTGRQPSLAPPPPTRLDTLQTRRPRHISPQRRPRSAFSPTMNVSAAGSIPRPSNDHRITHADTSRTNPRGEARSIPRGVAHVQEPPSRLPDNRHPAPVHPFQLGDVLHGINSNNANDDTRSTYNRRNQQARILSPWRNSASATTNDNVNRGGVAVRAGNSTSRLPTAGPTIETRRKRNLSVSSDDSQDFYVG